MKKLKKIYPWLFALCLLGFSLYALLDSFVISRVYETVEAEAPLSAAEPESAAESLPLSSRGSTAEAGTDPVSEAEEAAEAEVTLETYRVADTTVYVASISAEDVTALRTAFSQSSYGRNVTAAASDTAAAVGALLAVNGDNYGSRESGYVIRNGVLYRDSAAGDQEDLVIWSDGSFEIVNEREVTARELLERGAWQVFSFGPGLLENGEITVDENDEVDRAMASNPRTAIGQIGPGEYMLVVSDGRTDESRGLSLYELAEFLKSLGVQTAYNLDGGGSSTLVYEGSVINVPSSRRGERAVTDIVYVC